MNPNSTSTSQPPKRPVKLSSLKVNLEREKDGDWVQYPDWPGVEFHVSALNLPEYQTARQLMFQRLGKTYKNQPVPNDVMTVELGTLYAQHLLHNWRGFDEDYTPELAVRTLTDPANRLVVAAIEWCAAKVSEVDIEFAAAEQGN